LRNSSMLCWLSLKSCFTATSFLFGNIPYKFNVFLLKKGHQNESWRHFWHDLTFFYANIKVSLNIKMNKMFCTKFVWTKLNMFIPWT
jgi:hypothetical protein